MLDRDEAPAGKVKANALNLQFDENQESRSSSDREGPSTPIVLV